MGQGQTKPFKTRDLKNLALEKQYINDPTKIQTKEMKQRRKQITYLALTCRFVNTFVALHYKNKITQITKKNNDKIKNDVGYNLNTKNLNIKQLINDERELEYIINNIRKPLITIMEYLNRDLEYMLYLETGRLMPIISLMIKEQVENRQTMKTISFKNIFRKDKVFCANVMIIHFKTNKIMYFEDELKSAKHEGKIKTDEHEEQKYDMSQETQNVITQLDDEEIKDLDNDKKEIEVLMIFKLLESIIKSEKAIYEKKLEEGYVQRNKRVKIVFTYDAMINKITNDTTYINTVCERFLSIINNISQLGHDKIKNIITNEQTKLENGVSEIINIILYEKYKITPYRIYNIFVNDKFYCGNMLIFATNKYKMRNKQGDENKDTVQTLKDEYLLKHKQNKNKAKTIADISKKKKDIIDQFDQTYLYEEKLSSMQQKDNKNTEEEYKKIYAAINILIHNALFYFGEQALAKQNKWIKSVENDPIALADVMAKVEQRNRARTRDFRNAIIEQSEVLFAFMDVDYRSVFNQNSTQFSRGLRQVSIGINSNTFNMSPSETQLIFATDNKEYSNKLILAIQAKYVETKTKKKYVKNKTLVGENLDKQQYKELMEHDREENELGVISGRAKWVKTQTKQATVYKKHDDAGYIKPKILSNITHIGKTSEVPETKDYQMIENKETKLTMSNLQYNISVDSDVTDNVVVTFSLSANSKNIIKKTIARQKVVECPHKIPDWIKNVMKKTTTLILDISNLIKASKLSVLQINEFCTYVGYYGLTTVAIITDDTKTIKEADVNAIIPINYHDDEIILQYAHVMNAIVVSKDNFKEFAKYITVCLTHKSIIYRRGGTCHVSKACRLKMCNIGIKGKMVINDVKLYNEKYISSISISDPIVVDQYDKVTKYNTYYTKERMTFDTNTSYLTSINLANNSTPAILNIERTRLVDTVVTISFSWMNRHVTSTSNTMRSAILVAINEMDEDDLDTLMQSVDIQIKTNSENKVVAQRIGDKKQHRTIPTSLLSSGIIKEPIEINSRRWAYNTMVTNNNVGILSLTNATYNTTNLKNIVNGQFFYNEKCLRHKLMVCDWQGKFEFVALDQKLSDEIQRLAITNMAQDGQGMNFILTLPKTETIEQEFSYKPYQFIAENKDVGTDTMSNFESAQYPIYNTAFAQNLQLGLNMPDLHIQDEEMIHLNAITVNMHQIYRTSGNSKPFTFKSWVKATLMDDQRIATNLYPYLCSTMTEKVDITISAVDRDYHIGSEKYNLAFCKNIKDSLLSVASKATNYVAVSVMRLFNDLMNKRNKFKAPTLTVGYNLEATIDIEEPSIISIRWRMPLAACEMILYISNDKQYCVCLVLPSPPITLSYVSACIGTDVEFNNSYNDQICSIYENEAEEYVFGHAIMNEELCDYLPCAFLTYGVFAPALKLIGIDPYECITKHLIEIINPSMDDNMDRQLANKGIYEHVDSYTYLIERSKGNMHVKLLDIPFIMQVNINHSIHQMLKAIATLTNPEQKRKGSIIIISEIGILYGYDKINEHIIKCTNVTGDIKISNSTQLQQNLMKIKKVHNCIVPKKTIVYNKSLLESESVITAKNDIIITTKTSTSAIRSNQSNIVVTKNENIKHETNIMNVVPSFKNILWIHIEHQNQREDRLYNIKQLIWPTNRIIRHTIQPIIGETNTECFKRSLEFAVSKSKTILFTCYDRFMPLLSQEKQDIELKFKKDIKIFVPDVLTFNKMKYLIKFSDNEDNTVKPDIDEDDLEPTDRRISIKTKEKRHRFGNNKNSKTKYKKMEFKEIPLTRNNKHLKTQGDKNHKTIEKEMDNSDSLALALIILCLIVIVIIKSYMDTFVLTLIGGTAVAAFVIYKIYKWYESKNKYSAKSKGKKDKTRKAKKQDNVKIFKKKHNSHSKDLNDNIETEIKREETDENNNVDKKNGNQDTSELTKDSDNDGIF